VDRVDALNELQVIYSKPFTGGDLARLVAPAAFQILPVLMKVQSDN
jgi:hypothetical protein